MAQGIFNTGFPRKFFTEHGEIQCTMVVRYHPMFLYETHFLDRIDVGYDELIGEQFSNDLAPRKISQRELFGDATSSSAFHIQPYNQWRRSHVNFVHDDFDLESGEKRDTGYPILRTPGINEAAMRIVPADYTKIFKDVKLGHWNWQAINKVNALRLIDIPERSFLLEVL